MLSMVGVEATLVWQIMGEMVYLTTQFGDDEYLHVSRRDAKRRDRYDIMSEILENARGGAIKTHIMYKAKLSYAQMNEYIPLLMQKGYLETIAMVRRRRIKVLLKTSRQGEEFIRNFRVLKV